MVIRPKYINKMVFWSLNCLQRYCTKDFPAYVPAVIGLKMNNNRVLITFRKAVTAQAIAPYFLGKGCFVGIAKP